MKPLEGEKVVHYHAQTHNIASTSCASTPTLSKKAGHSQFEQKVDAFFKYQIESDTSMASSQHLSISD
jgi:hypothetical protein